MTLLRPIIGGGGGGGGGFLKKECLDYVLCFKFVYVPEISTENRSKLCKQLFHMKRWLFFQGGWKVGFPGCLDGCFLRGLKLSISRKAIALDWSGTLKVHFITTSMEWTKVLLPPTPLPLCGALLTSTGWQSRSPSWIAMTLAIPTTPQPLSGEPIACFDTIQTCMMRRHWKVCCVFPFWVTAYSL